MPVEDTPTDELDEIEKKAIARAASTEDWKKRSEALEIVRTVTERRKMLKEMKKIELDAQDAVQEQKFGRAKFWASAMTPLLAVALTGAALLLQTAQFRAGEETQWRDAVNRISLKTPG